MAEPWQLPTDRMPTEHEEQRDFIRWFRREYPKRRIFAIPNGGHRSGSQGMKLKAEGVVRGVPDLFIPCAGIWVEMKKQKDGRTSKEQDDWLRYLERCGYHTVVAYGSSDAKEKVKAILGQ